MAPGMSLVYSQPMIPPLPDDVALDCLYRVPAGSHSNLLRVCTSWKTVVESHSFGERRVKLGYADDYACFVQAAVPPVEDLDPSPSPLPPVEDLDPSPFPSPSPSPSFIFHLHLHLHLSSPCPHDQRRKEMLHEKQ